VGAVVGATHPALLVEMRAEMPHSWLLLPGFGAQGATAADTRGAFRPDGLGALVVGARALTFPDTKNAAWEADPRSFVATKVDEANHALRSVLGW
jgi:orotidine-5'-phosphate decarboxylase